MDEKAIELSRALRNKVLIYCDELFANDRNTTAPGDYRGTFWSEIHRTLRYRQGQPVLNPELTPRSHAEDALAFLEDCSANEFLDFLEDMFRVDCFWHVAPHDQNEVVEDLNTLIASERAPFSLTSFSYETTEEPWLGETPREITRTTATPRVILQESDALHVHSIQPALVLLSAPEFKVASAEFLDALTDYRKQDYPDCLTKCCRDPSRVL